MSHIDSVPGHYRPRLSVAALLPFTLEFAGHPMSTQAERVSDVEFILSEVKRLKRGGYKSLPRMALLQLLPHPSGTGGQLCSPAAWEKIDSLAEQAGHAAKLNGRVELKALATPLAKLLVERFQRDGAPITGQAVDRVLAAAARQAKHKCRDITHYIPCHLMWVDEPPELLFGPITFLNRASFVRRVTASAKAFRNKDGPAGRAYYRFLLSGALQYFRAFKWVAEVTIPNCDVGTSEDIAHRSVTSALDCLHLLLGPDYTEKMRIGGPRMTTDKRGRLQLHANGNLFPSMSTGGPGQVGFDEGWSTVLEQADYRIGQSLMGIALEAAVDPHIVRPLSARFLDAASWFGEAVRETSPAARIVKFVTAIERMVMTEEKEDIASRVAERVSALCCDRARPESRAEWKADAARAYGLRSKLVHGSISPYEPAVSQGGRLCARLARHTLLTALSTYGEPGLRDENAPSTKLAEHYNAIVARADERERDLSVN